MVEVTLSAVSERDVDLLVVEELATSEAFAQWFLSRAGLSSLATLVKVAHSVSTSNGESDIELTVQVNGATHRVLLENKVDAVFQPEQPERYHARAAAYVAKGTCDRVTTVLLAPEKYLNGCRTHVSFDHFVSLDDVLSEISLHEPGSARTAYKASVLTKALERARNGWVPVPDPSASAYWTAYWRLVEQIAPELQMREPGPKPAGSTWIYFRPPALPAGVDLVHKLIDGHVDLQFAGMGARMHEMRASYRQGLEDGMTIAPAGKSVAVRIRVPPSAFPAPLTGQEAVAEEVIRSAAR